MPGPELCALSAQSWETLVELDAKYDELLHRLNNLEKEVTQLLSRYATAETPAADKPQGWAVPVDPGIAPDRSSTESDC